jgi:hypothetical protein
MVFFLGNFVAVAQVLPVFSCFCFHCKKYLYENFTQEGWA